VGQRCLAVHNYGLKTQALQSSTRACAALLIATSGVLQPHPTGSHTTPPALPHPLCFPQPACIQTCQPQPSVRPAYLPTCCCDKSRTGTLSHPAAHHHQARGAPSPVQICQQQASSTVPMQAPTHIAGGRGTCCICMHELTLTCQQAGQVAVELTCEVASASAACASAAAASLHCW
jgi:hypothetical protein